MSERVWTGLAAAAADGVACVICGLRRRHFLTTARFIWNGATFFQQRGQIQCDAHTGDRGRAALFGE